MLAPCWRNPLLTVVDVDGVGPTGPALCARCPALAPQDSLRADVHACTAANAALRRDLAQSDADKAALRRDVVALGRDRVSGGACRAGICVCAASRSSALVVEAGFPPEG